MSSTAEEMLSSLTEEEIAAYTANQEEERHIIVDETKKIIVPDELKRIAVQYDHNIETVTFDGIRYWDGHDMSTMHVYINYMLANKALGCYMSEDVTVDPDDENIIHFTWTISRNVTQAIGQGIIAIQSCVNNLRAKEIAKKISDETTVIAARAERLWMNLLGGGCRVPMGAILEPQNKNFLFTAYLSDPANGNFLRLAQKFSAEDLAENICEKSLKNFAEKFIAECRKKNIRLPSDVAGTEAIAAFWNAEH